MIEMHVISSSSKMQEGQILQHRFDYCSVNYSSLPHSLFIFTLFYIVMICIYIHSFHEQYFSILSYQIVMFSTPFLCVFYFVFCFVLYMYNCLYFLLYIYICVRMFFEKQFFLCLAITRSRSVTIYICAVGCGCESPSICSASSCFFLRSCSRLRWAWMGPGAGLALVLKR